MKNFFGKIKIYARVHKKTTALIILALVYGGYSVYGKLTDTGTETRYMLSAAAKGTLIASVSGSGQVSATDQMDIRSKVSGDIVSVVVKSGQTVKTGDIIARIDATEASKALRDAETNLETARLSYEKLVAPNDALSTLQWQNTIAKAKESKTTAEDNLQKAYDDGFNNVSNAFLELPGIMTGLDSIIYNADNSLGGFVGQENVDYYGAYAKMYEGNNSKADQYVAEVKANYVSARTNYDANFISYKNTNRSADVKDVEALIIQTYDTAKKIADTVKSANNLIQYYKDQSTLRNVNTKPLADTHLSTLSGYTSKTNSYLTSLLGSTNDITTNKNTITNTARTIAENELSFQKFEDGADPLDVRNSKITITQKENALSDARTTLSYYTIRAPFDGLIAKVNAKKGDSVSGGTSVATLVTKQQIATLSLNEVDVSKIKTEQKATMTFDAVDGLTITGVVTDVDTIGAVSQGVATYSVKITFDMQDDRVKPGMTVSAVIVNNVKTDALTVPNSAVKTTADGTYYVEMFDPPLAEATATGGAPSAIPPKQVTVTVGISNDTETEILSGLKDGDLVVTRTTTGAQATAAKTGVSTRSLFGGGKPGG
jgi:RND family efflux transporter MFP subunit